MLIQINNKKTQAQYANLQHIYNEYDIKENNRFSSAMQLTSYPAILALKNIVGKVKDQICMRSLTIAIRQHCLEQQQTHLKDNYLRFFLQCEGQLKRNTTSEWQRVIDFQIKKIVGSEKLFHFLRLKVYRDGFQKINAYAQLDEIIKIEQKICEEFDDLKDMEISQDVKVKTKYFFKWCQFIAEKNQIKKMKNKEIEDLKKSKIFNQYSLKFSSFIKWKLYLRRIKTIKSKAIQLEKKTKTTKLQQIFLQIKEKIQIISIEKMLEVAVANKLQNISLKSVFYKLKQNKLKQGSLMAKLKKKGNIWLYRFYGQLKKRSTPLYNKSSVLSREQIEDQYQKLCKLTCWKGLRLKLKQTKEKVSLIHLNVKKSSFKQLVKLSYSKRHISRQSKELLAFFKALLFKNFISAVKYSVTNKNQKINQEKSVNELMNKNYFNWFRNNLSRKRIENQKLNEKLTIMKLKTQNIGKKVLITNLKNIKKNKIDFSQKVIYLKNHIAMNLFHARLMNFKQCKTQKQQLQAQLQIRHNKKLMKMSLKGLKCYKKVKIGEFQTFNNLFSLIDLKIKSDIINQLKQRTETTKNLCKLIKASEFVALKVSFITILNKMLTKKMRIKSFCTKKDTQLKRKLFDMLINNSEHMHISTNKAQQFYMRYSKKQFLNSLSSELQSASKDKLVVKTLEQNRKSMLFKRFKQKIEKRDQCEQAEFTVNTIFKASRFQEFFQSAKQLVSYKRQEQKKMLKIQRCTIKGYVKRMREFLKDKKKRYQEQESLNNHYSSLISEIQLNLSIKTLKFMLRQTETALNKKEWLLKASKRKQLFKLLKFNRNNKVVKKQLKVLRSIQISTIFLEKSDFNQKRQTLKGYLDAVKRKKAFITFKNNVITDFQERQIKENQLKSYLERFRLKQTKKILLNRIREKHQLSENSSLLCNRIAAQGFQRFMNGYFELKSQQLKQLAALKHYAANVKRRGMRSLKYSINISLLKENRAKTQNYSKILMQKSMDNARKKSKLMQTIQRYNMSRVSRILR